MPCPSGTPVNRQTYSSGEFLTDLPPLVSGMFPEHPLLHEVVEGYTDISPIVIHCPLNISNGFLQSRVRSRLLPTGRRSMFWSRTLLNIDSLLLCNQKFFTALYITTF